KRNFYPYLIFWKRNEIRIFKAFRSYFGFVQRQPFLKQAAERQYINQFVRSFVIHFDLSVTLNWCFVQITFASVPFVQLNQITYKNVLFLIVSCENII